jgi:hypothetical protein
MTLHWDDAQVARLLTSENGPVAKTLLRKAVLVDASAKRLLSSHGRGRVYRLSNPKRTHQASAPGESPATDLGRLRASINYAIAVDSIGLYSWVGTNVSYAGYLERGTSRMAPRPYLRPALFAARGPS